MAGRLVWLIYKDIVSEYRARRVWPTMFLLGLVVTVLVGLQMGPSAEGRGRITGGLFWLTVALASLPTLERSFASEQEDGCWDSLMLYPAPPMLLYTAKLLTNVLALAVFEIILSVAFAVFADISLWHRPGPAILVALLADLGIASLGTLLAAAAARNSRNGDLVRLIALPALVPVFLAGAESFRLLRDGPLTDDWWRWVQLLGAFGVLYATAGLVLFAFLIED